MDYPELQEKISELVEENKELRGEPYLRDELLGCLAFVSNELIEYIESGKAGQLQSFVDNVQYILKQLPDDIKY